MVGTSGNDTINAVLDIGTTPSSTTLQIADVIDGGAGTDTMNVTLATATSTIPAATIKNVEVFNIRNVASTVGGGENFANITGETKIVSAGSQAALVLSGVGSGTTLGVSDTAQNLTATYAANAFAVGSTLNLDLSNAGTNVSGTITRSTIDVGQATAAGAATGVSIAATGANYVTLAASGANDIAAAAGIKTLTVTGAGTVDILNTSTLESSSTLAADLTKVDASANTGGVTIQVANKDVAVTGGAGADVVTLANAVALGAASVNLGAGNDKLLNSASAGLGTTSVIDGGAGTDTIVATLLQVGNQANIKNFEVLDVVGENRTIDASLFSASNFSSIAVSGALGGATAVQKLSGTTLNVDVTGATTTGAALTATLKDATGTADVANINFAGTGSKIVTSFGSSGIETYNIVSGGTLATQTNAVTTLTDTLNTTAKVVITGANALTVGAITTNTAATTATATVASALKEIDASAATGNVTLGNGTALGTSAAIGASGFNTTYDGLKVTTGSGSDTITIAAKNAVVVAGAGDDIVTVSGTGASVDTGAAKTATGDTVNFNNENQSATFGAGKQTAVIGAAADVGTALTSVTTITGAATGDVINLAAALTTAASVDSITDVTASIGSAASLAAALNVAEGLGAEAAAGDLVYFRWVDGNTYILADKVGADAGDLIADAADAVVKLVGSYNSMTATDGIITLG